VQDRQSELEAPEQVEQFELQARQVGLKLEGGEEG